ncbi:MAG: diguanylate cyclase [Anaerovoracaceae bacterium]
MKDEKDFLKGKIEEYRFLPIDDTLFHYYDQYEGLCRESDDSEGLLYLTFCKGETYFRLGDYHKAENLLNSCIFDSSSDASLDILSRCHNLIGLLNVAMGQELPALENYMMSIEYSSKCANTKQQIITLLNMTWLYRDVGDFDKALKTGQDALTLFQADPVSGAYNLELLMHAYRGQLFFMMGRYDEAMKVLDTINNLKARSVAVFYEVPLKNFFIRAYHYLNDTDNLQKMIDALIDHATDKDDFLEFSEAFLNICEYILTFSKENTRRLLDSLHINIDSLEIYFLKMRLQRLEVLYAQKYCSNDAFLHESGKYMMMDSKYTELIRYNKRCSLQRIELLKKVQKERQLYFEQSRLDLMTGLLNKVSFEQMIGRILNNRIEKLPAACTLIVLDLDNFKRVNDRLGHMTGDKIITAVSESLTEVFGEEALIGRVGGDEFAVFLPNNDSDKEVFKQAIALQRTFALNRDVCELAEKHNLNISISIGIMFDINTPLDYENAFKRADKQLYLAKASGKNIICIESARF